jgi:hypothetical protein
MASAAAAAGVGAADEALGAAIEACLLGVVASQDTAALRAAEASLTALLRHRDAASALFAVLARSQHAIARQFAGVLLRTRIWRWWNELGVAGAPLGGGGAAGGGGGGGGGGAGGGRAGGASATPNE